MEPNTFSTRDLYLASTLIVLKFPLLSVDIEIEGSKARGIGYFRFEESQELREARLQYNQGSIRIEPRALVNTIQSLKSDIINQSRELAIRPA
jgi:hypothetical protein